MEKINSQKSNDPQESCVFFDLSGSSVFINYKNHLDQNEDFKQMIRVQSEQAVIRVDLLNKRNNIDISAQRLKHILKYL